MEDKLQSSLYHWSPGRPICFPTEEHNLHIDLNSSRVGIIFTGYTHFSLQTSFWIYQFIYCNLKNTDLNQTQVCYQAVQNIIRTAEWRSTNKKDFKLEHHHSFTL